MQIPIPSPSLGERGELPFYIDGQDGQDFERGDGGGGGGMLGMAAPFGQVVGLLGFARGFGSLSAYGRLVRKVGLAPDSVH